MKSKKPTHIHPHIWQQVEEMNVERLAGQLTMYDPVVGKICTGMSIEELVASGAVGTVMNIAVNNLTETSDKFMYHTLQDIATANGHPPLLCGADFQRGACVIGPSGFGAPNSWNPALIEAAARRAGEHSAISGVSLTFSPVADHSFGTKQGRNQEGGAVESPLLMSQIVRAMVRGYQGSDLREQNAIVSTVKHVGPYQYTEGPDYTAIPLSERAFLEDCWPTFEAGLREGARAVMMSFVAFNGTPSHASAYLSGLVRRYGHPGTVIISDFTGINELVEFGVAGNEREAAFLAFAHGGVHLDLNGGIYDKELPELVREGRITMTELRCRVADVLQLKFDLGLYDNPQKYCRGSEARTRLKEHVPEYRMLAEESIVLLKPKVPNTRVLPIPSNACVLVTGPLADSPKEWIGEWCANALSHLDSVVTAFVGIKSVWPSAELLPCGEVERPHLHSPFLFTHPNDESRQEQKMTHVVVFLGERQEWSGESKVRLLPRIPPAQVHFVKKLKSATDAVIHVIITSGRPLAIPNELARCADSILWVPQLGSFAGEAIANVLSGKTNPSGRLAYSLPCHEGVTSGFSHREPRKGRPAVPLNSETFKYRHATGWSAHYQELGERATLAGYRFGEGYSYTEFEYSDSKLNKGVLSVESREPLVASVTVKNIGQVRGKETVQLYMHDSVSTTVPRELELLNWRQVVLDPNESVTVHFQIVPSDLATYGMDISRGLEPHPDEYPVYLFIAKNSGECLSGNTKKKRVFFDPNFAGTLKFVLAE